MESFTCGVVTLVWYETTENMYIRITVVVLSNRIWAPALSILFSPDKTVCLKSVQTLF